MASQSPTDINGEKALTTCEKWRIQQIGYKHNTTFFMEDWRNSTPNIELFSDGSADPNPGTGGYGIILRYNGISKEFSCGFSLTTNNRMEIMGIVCGLEMFKTKSNVQVYTDSSYVVNTIKNKWIETWIKNGWKTTTGAPVQNIDLWKRLYEMLEKHNVVFNWIKGHVGHPENERCDFLSKNSYANSESLCVDEGYEPREKSPQKILKEGDLCRKCLTPVIKKNTSNKSLKKNRVYHFEYYFLCPNCKTMYMVEEAKIFTTQDNSKELF